MHIAGKGKGGVMEGKKKREKKEKKVRSTTPEMVYRWCWQPWETTRTWFTGTNSTVEHPNFSQEQGI